MSLLTMIQNAALEQGLPKPETVINSSDVTTRQMLALAHRTIADLRARASWPRLTKEHTITLTNAVSSYEMPSDIDRQVHRTHWNRNRKWEIVGPLTPQEWQSRKRGITGVTPRQHFRLRGWNDRSVFIDPEPTVSDEGHVISFEYQTVSAIRPKLWEYQHLYLPNEFVGSEGNVYYTILGGLSGSVFLPPTPPVHTSGSASDLGVIWEYFTENYDTFRHDTDECLLDESMVSLGIQWRFMQQKGLSYEKVEGEYEKYIQREITAEIGARTLSLSGGARSPLVNILNVPDSGIGL